MSTDSLVLVTGASGFIASHVVNVLQGEGYRVRGTVSCLTDEDKVQSLYSLCPNAKYKLELVEADLTKQETWESAVKNVEYVIHMASRCTVASPDDEGELIKPAVEGTVNVLKACARTKTVKRVVLTSSCTAVAFEDRPDFNEKIRTEEDWSDPSKLEPYAKSQTLVERAAWDFVKELSADTKMELAVINPALVMGPVQLEQVKK